MPYNASGSPGKGPLAQETPQVMRMVRILSTVMVLGAFAWTGWWHVLARGQEAALAAWFDDRARHGWQAEREYPGDNADRGQAPLHGKAQRGDVASE